MHLNYEYLNRLIKTMSTESKNAFAFKTIKNLKGYAEQSLTHGIWSQKTESESLAPAPPSYVVWGNEFDLYKFYPMPHSFTYSHSFSQKKKKLNAWFLEPLSEFESWLHHLITVHVT